MSEAVQENSAFAIRAMLETIISHPVDKAVLAIQAFMHERFPASEMAKAFLRNAMTRKIEDRLKADGGTSFDEISAEFACPADVVRAIWRGARHEILPTQPPANFRMAIPKEKRARNLVEDALLRGGFSMDAKNEKEGYIVDHRASGMQPIPYRIWRGGDIFHYLDASAADGAIIGNDRRIENAAEAILEGRRPVALDIYQAFCINDFRMCLAIPAGEAEKAKAQGKNYFDGKIIATAYPSTLKAHLQEEGIEAKVIAMEGEVEEAVKQLALLNVGAIMDIVQSGKSLRDAGLVTAGKPLYEGEMNFIGTADVPRSEAAQRIVNNLTQRLREPLRLVA